jgi:LytS/YehU family sensor histidine kinase
LAYISTVIATTLCCTLFITSGYYIAAYFSDQTLVEMFGVAPDQYSKIFLTWALPSSAAVMTLGMSVKLAKNWLDAEKRKDRLEKENLETELKYLKSQINPHFLFNTINSIFALIHKNPDLASESLANFSDMLRYQLYECNDEKIGLAKELHFIENFIDLEKLRLNQELTEMQFNIQGNSPSSQTIAPFILIPFIENAFKHVSKGKGQKNFIRMQLDVNDLALNLKIENSFINGKKIPNDISQCSGIGLKNVRRRLDLIYEDKHYLWYNAKDNKFSVILKLEW